MVSRFSFMLALVALAAMSANAGPGGGSQKVDLRVVREESDIYILLVNNPDKDVRVAHPFILGAAGSSMGIEFSFRRVGGGESDQNIATLCAMIDTDPDYFPKPMNLVRNAVVGERMALKSLKEFHCLKSGTYDMKVRYHNRAMYEDLQKFDLETTMRVTIP